MALVTVDTLTMLTRVEGGLRHQESIDGETIYDQIVTDPNQVDTLLGLLTVYDVPLGVAFCRHRLRHHRAPSALSNKA